MNKTIKTALISVFYKDGLEPIIHLLNKNGVQIISTGGTMDFITKLGVNCVSAESLTGYPAILGGRVKTLHPVIFGGILAKRDDAQHRSEMDTYKIPEIDLVIVDLYPFEETLANLKKESADDNIDESVLIEKIDIGGPSMIRAAAKNHKDVVVLASKNDYGLLEEILQNQNGATTLEQRRNFAIKAFDVCTHYDNAISSYFNQVENFTPFHSQKTVLRYGENPHQKAVYFGNKSELFEQLNGKEISYNNLVDIDAALNLIAEFKETTFAIIKHTNVCGVAQAKTVKLAWDKALAGDPESAFGGVLVCNGTMDEETANAINELFFEVLLAPKFDDSALKILKSKKNRILLQYKPFIPQKNQTKSLLNGLLVQDIDAGNIEEWKEVGGRVCSENEKQDLLFANIICKHLKSNAIAIVHDKQLLGKGCGQTSRIDALRQSIEKAKQFGFDLNNSVLASDAFFPFDDCVKIAHQAGVNSFIQPGGSIRDKDSIDYCLENNLAMVLTNQRHFKH